MSLIAEYLSTVSGPEHDLLEHMYGIVRAEVPDATEVLSYNMPAFAHKGKAFIAILSNKKFMSLYPFCGLQRLDIDFSDYECTTGSIHFSPDRPISDELLRRIIRTRLESL